MTFISLTRTLRFLLRSVSLMQFIPPLNQPCFLRHMLLQKASTVTIGVRKLKRILLLTGPRRCRYVLNYLPQHANQRIHWICILPRSWRKSFLFLLTVLLTIQLRMVMCIIIFLHYCRLYLLLIHAWKRNGPTVNLKIILSMHLSLIFQCIISLALRRELFSLPNSNLRKKFHVLNPIWLSLRSR